MLIKLHIECAHIRTQFFSDEFFKNFRKRIRSAVALVTRSLVNKTDDANTGKSAKLLATLTP
jgi:hypothetical protein